MSSTMNMELFIKGKKDDWSLVSSGDSLSMRDLINSGLSVVECSVKPLDFDFDKITNDIFESIKYKKYIGYISEDLFVKYYWNHPNSDTRTNSSYYVFQNESDIDKDLLKNIVQETNKLNNEKVVDIYVYTYEKNHFCKGEFYTLNNFCNALKIIESKLENINTKLNKLLDLVNTIDYYKLTSDQKDNLMEDINYTEEDREFWNNNKDVVVKMIGVMEYFLYNSHNKFYPEDIVLYMYKE